MAQKLNLNITGTLALLLVAKREAVIPTVKPIFDKIQSTNFRIATSLLESILKQAGE